MDKSINVVKELFLGIILFSMNFLSAQSFSDWENPDINGINKENPHAYGFLSEEKANIHGVGGDDTWGAKTMEKYTNAGNKSYHFGLIMEYIGKQFRKPTVLGNY